MRAVIGLGNPGRAYRGTRHNMGADCVRTLAKSWNIRLKKRAFLSKSAEVERKGRRVLLALPQTYMNLSGEAVLRLLSGRGIDPVNMIVVYDDLDIPLGEIRVRKEGGPGGHKGMISIIRAIESREFPRVRIGIGPLPDGEGVADFVLSAFADEESPRVEAGLAKARSAVELLVDGGIIEAMNAFNRRNTTCEVQGGRQDS